MKHSGQQTDLFALVFVVDGVVVVVPDATFCISPPTPIFASNSLNELIASSSLETFVIAFSNDGIKATDVCVVEIVVAMF